MGPGLNPMGKLLWHIAELGSRYSDPRWSGERARTWAALEQAVARAGAEVSGMVVAMETAQDRMRNADARERATQRERDEVVAANSRLADERDEAEGALALTRVERDRAQDALVLARSERDEAQAALARHWAGPGEPAAAVAAGPAPSPGAWDVSRAPRAQIPPWWKATPPAAPVAEETEQTEQTEVSGAELDLTDRVSYLSVRATPGRLLPGDFAGLLVGGASVVRREGRLAAVIAVRQPAAGWSQPSFEAGEQQARRLRDEGYRVEFTDHAIAS